MAFWQHLPEYIPSPRKTIGLIVPLPGTLKTNSVLTQTCRNMPTWNNPDSKKVSSIVNRCPYQLKITKGKHLPVNASQSME